MTQTHALFLEWHCLQAVKKAGRYGLENGNAGSKPHAPAPLAADCMEIFETGSTLLATLGHPVFDPVGGQHGTSKSSEIFYCKVTGIDGRGLHTAEGFVVSKGSVGKRDNVPSFSQSNLRFRQRLLEAGVMKEVGDTVVFQKDHLFGSPSMAAIALLGRTSNGWKEWKNEDGVTLDELKRPADGEEAPSGWGGRMTDATTQERIDRHLFVSVAEILADRLPPIVGAKVQRFNLSPPRKTGTHGWMCELAIISPGVRLQLWYDQYLSHVDGRFFSVWVRSTSEAGSKAFARDASIDVRARIGERQREKGRMTADVAAGDWLLDCWSYLSVYYVGRYSKYGHAAHGVSTIVSSLLKDVRTLLSASPRAKTEPLAKRARPRFSPSDPVTMRLVEQRAGQGVFRKAVLKHFRSRCVISGCDLPEVLDAAHIVPYSEKPEQDPTRALLLRADLHVLFDRGMIAIVQKRGKATVEIVQDLEGTDLYGDLAGPLRGAVHMRASHWRALAERPRHSPGGT